MCRHSHSYETIGTPGAKGGSTSKSRKFFRGVVTKYSLNSNWHQALPACYHPQIKCSKKIFCWTQCTKTEWRTDTRTGIIHVYIDTLLANLLVKFQMQQEQIRLLWMNVWWGPFTNLQHFHKLLINIMVIIIIFRKYCHWFLLKCIENFVQIKCQVPSFVVKKLSPLQLGCKYDTEKCQSLSLFQIGEAHPYHNGCFLRIESLPLYTIM